MEYTIEQIKEHAESLGFCDWEETTQDGEYITAYNYDVWIQIHIPTGDVEIGVEDQVGEMTSGDWFVDNVVNVWAKKKVVVTVRN